MRRWLAGVTLLLVVGCSAPTLQPDAAVRLETAVAEVVSAAADGDYASALQQTQAVRAELDRAADDGALTVARYRRIDAALTRVVAELTALLEAAAAAESGDQDEAAAGDRDDERDDKRDEKDDDDRDRRPPPHSKAGGRGRD